MKMLEPEIYEVIISVPIQRFVTAVDIKQAMRLASQLLAEHEATGPSAVLDSESIKPSILGIVRQVPTVKKIA